MNRPIYAGTGVFAGKTGEVEGGYRTLSGERFYRIRNYDCMPPFFMNIVSSSDLWLFLSSSGGLTAGRKDSGQALFPYYTEDKLTENAGNTGPVTIMLVTVGERTWLWEPFSSGTDGLYAVERNLYKNVTGNTVLFEERNGELGLTFRYSWRTSNARGLVRTSELENWNDGPCSVRILDGLRNILPYGAGGMMQAEFSCLLDAYKRCELEKSSGLGLFSMSSTLTDHAEPSESLRATVVWQTGLVNPVHLLSTAQLDAFRKGESVREETDVRGRRGAYLVAFETEPAGHGTLSWKITADVNQDGTAAADLARALATDPEGMEAALEADIEQSGRELVAMIAAADGLQRTGDEAASAHHFTNVLFNTLRGGIFPRNYRVESSDFLEFVSVRNSGLTEAAACLLSDRPDGLTWMELDARASASGMPDLERLALEYLPLAFSRRHGDPSRPWNRFSISIRKPDGSMKLDYQGNWRDIFQNWEPLAVSYPRFLPGMIARFLNATTFDGYNPYRITRDGFEWEKPEPGNPWANIGYWGDHQIIYLSKLLELSRRHDPDDLLRFLPKRIFSHANVPYRIREYRDIRKDWYSTIDFDRELDGIIEERVKAMGTDGRLAVSADGKVVHASMAEKLLILLLVKLTNFVPDGGIWMNTQRPEWNDANNALTGKGLSVVTLAYLRRFIVVLEELFAKDGNTGYPVSREVITLYRAVRTVLEECAGELGGHFGDARRHEIMDALGVAGSEYRWNYYRRGISGDPGGIDAGEMESFLGLCRSFCDHGLRTNRRPDGLYHSYNVLRLNGTGASISRLSEMLEGQVAVLSSRMLTGKESLSLLETLEKSALYTADRNSYLLYPDRRLPGFLEKNRVDRLDAERIGLVTMLDRGGDRTILSRDGDGFYRWAGGFRNAKDVERALDALHAKNGYEGAVAADRESVLELFERTFRHEEFTGRSGTFFAYEGLGSIYWHMVAKLLLAVQETIVRTSEESDDDTAEALHGVYGRIRSGLGFRKTPSDFGAFPTDPYSHTPSGRGAQQPGMTGQVKEEILTRQGELGLGVRDGSLTFNPILLAEEEFVNRVETFRYVDVSGTARELELPPASCVFTVCQVPVVYLADGGESIEVRFADGTRTTVHGISLRPALSGRIFDRDGTIESLTVHVQARL